MMFFRTELLLFPILFGLCRLCATIDCPTQPGYTMQQFSSYKCIYLKTTTSLDFSVHDAVCSRIGSAYSVESATENNKLRNFLSGYQACDSAYIGYVYINNEWKWTNEERTNYTNFQITDPDGPTTIPPPTQKPTLPPSQQNVFTSIVIAIDATYYSPFGFSAQEVVFAKSLVEAVTARGPAEFALYMYGCQNTVHLNYSTTTEGFIQQLNYANSTIMGHCNKTQGAQFSQARSDLGWYYFNVGTLKNYFRNPESKQFSIIFFSANTNSAEVMSNPSFGTVDGGSVIGISVGPRAVPLSYYSVPAGNTEAVNDVSDASDLVSKVYKRIFGKPLAPIPSLQYRGSELAAGRTYDTCVIIDPTNGRWNVTECTTKTCFFCQGSPTEVGPTLPTNNVCANGFQSISALDNSRCYAIGSPQTFTEAQANCIPNTFYQNPPLLTSIASEQELTALSEMSSSWNNSSNEMFWIGLWHLSPDPWDSWQWVNKEPARDLEYWRKGYPRFAFGSNCVALVVSTQDWINVECSLKLPSICSYLY